MLLSSPRLVIVSTDVLRKCLGTEFKNVSLFALHCSADILMYGFSPTLAGLSTFGIYFVGISCSPSLVA